MNASFAACDMHLTNFLTGIVPRNHTKVLRVSHVEKPDATYKCGCGEYADWFVLESATPQEITAESLAKAGFYRANQGYERD